GALRMRVDSAMAVRGEGAGFDRHSAGSGQDKSDPGSAGSLHKKFVRSWLPWQPLRIALKEAGFKIFGPDAGLPVFPPFGTVLHNPIGQRLLKPDNLTRLLR